MPRVAWSSWGELRNFADISALTNISGAPGQTLPNYMTKHLRRAYYAAVSYTDHNIGARRPSPRLPPRSMRDGGVHSAAQPTN
jgi:hypothetical protein